MTEAVILRNKFYFSSAKKKKVFTIFSVHQSQITHKQNVLLF